MTNSHPRDPLHGVTLETIVTTLVERHGWAGPSPAGALFPQQLDREIQPHISLKRALAHAAPGP